METLIVIAIVFAFSLYYDLRYRGIPVIVPILAGAAGISINVLLGRYELFDGVFVISIFITMFFVILMAFGILRSGDAYLLIVMMWTTPFVGFVIPAVVCLMGSLVAGFVYCFVYCCMKNIRAKKKAKSKPYSDIKYDNFSNKIFGKYITYANTSKMPVNAISAVTHRDGQAYLDPKIGRKQKQMTCDRYLIPVIPLTPFIAGVYLLVLFFTLV